MAYLSFFTKYKPSKPEWPFKITYGFLLYLQEAKSDWSVYNYATGLLTVFNSSIWPNSAL